MLDKILLQHLPVEYVWLHAVLSAVKDLKPELVFARISGYGQTGPKSHLAGYASVCEAYGGFR